MLNFLRTNFVTTEFGPSDPPDRYSRKREEQREGEVGLEIGQKVTQTHPRRRRRGTRGPPFCRGDPPRCGDSGMAPATTGRGCLRKPRRYSDSGEGAKDSAGLRTPARPLNGPVRRTPPPIPLMKCSLCSAILCHIQWVGSRGCRKEYFEYRACFED